MLSIDRLISNCNTNTFLCCKRNLDYISVMTYDNAGSYDGKTGHHSGYAYSTSTLEFFHNKGIDKEKLLIGIPFYGKEFTLKDTSNHKIGAPITGEDTDVDYVNVCGLVKNSNYTKEQTSSGHDPIAYHGNKWIGYDDPNQAYL